MLQDLVDRAFLEDFLSGVSNASGMTALVYDSQRRLLATGVARRSTTDLTQVTELPLRLTHLRVMADEPPAHLDLYETDNGAYLVAGIHLEQLVVGHVAIGPFALPSEPRRAEDSEADGAPDAPGAGPGQDLAAEASRDRADESFPVLDPVWNAKPIRTVRWAARMLSDACRRERRTQNTQSELALVGDIAGLVAGERDLQTVLNRIAAQTAQVMQCRFASLRLLKAEKQELEMVAGYNLSQRYLEHGMLRDATNPIDTAALEGEVIYVADATDDARVQEPQEARREGIVSVLTTGLLYRGTAVGVIRVYTDRPQRFRPAQRDLLKAVASQAATAITTARLLEDRLSALETQRELELARQVQDRMHTRDLPNHHAFDLAHVFRPSSTLSGDLVDFVPLREGDFAIFIADVVGKGVPAALLGASLRGALRSAVHRTPDFGALFTALNQQLCQETESGEFVTALLLRVLPDEQRFEFVSAGHEPPLLLRDGRVRRVEEGHLVLGLDPSERYQTMDRDFNPNDVLLLYTDGAIDAVNYDGDHFGRQRLDDALHAGYDMSAKGIVENALWSIRRFSGLAEQADDITMIAIKSAPRGAASPPPETNAPASLSQ